MKGFVLWAAYPALSPGNENIVPQGKEKYFCIISR
jgi:hypothetical protein